MSNQNSYQPPYTLNSVILRLVADISELVGRFSALTDLSQALQLRRVNRIRTIRGSLAIEGNTLSETQITAILDGKRVIAPPREIQEVRNAIAAYDRFDTWQPEVEDDLLEAHGILMAALIDKAGAYRFGGVGVMAGSQVVHMAPPADRVPALMCDLFHWLAVSQEHPLITSSVFHYEFEFIHPFADGNGRMGRLWQSLILARWNPLFADLPVESLVFENQAEYYQALQESTRQTDSAPFIEFMLSTLCAAIREAVATDQVGDQVTDQVLTLIEAIGTDELGSKELMKALGLSHRPTFRKNYLNPALKDNWIERTQPDSPRSPTQRYRLTGKGHRLLLS
ncbi:cell filamentation protein Fic [Syntrophotalea acetylenivorans]|uniref:Cell filamentation protein Fic n=1 Tax=Syntrophotalea acetylenivorans TaxID=1842532 RepID=A0A1L3GN35_9BACT|nr:Fic family protein [Syntrophotalea acetylenivorans]APG27078.1 cell filamentation protein Fic [Syntrophotalea acetylenivorans]